MSNKDDDEFGFKQLAKSFEPEAPKPSPVQQPSATVAKPPVPKPVPTRPVATTPVVPELPPVSKEEVAAAVPQLPTPESPAIQNPIFDPEFQKGAGLTLLAPALAGAGALGAGLYGYYKGKKSVKDRMMGEGYQTLGQGLQPTQNALNMPQLDPEWQKIVAQSERNRMAKQAEAMKNVSPVIQPKPDPVIRNASGTILGTLQPDSTIKSTPSINNATLQFETEIPTIADIAKQTAQTPTTVAPETRQAPPTMGPPAPTVGVPPEPAETPTGKKTGRPTKAEQEAKKAALAAFVPPAGAEKIPSEWGKGMGWLVGAYGVQGAQSFIDRFNEGKPFQSYQEFENKYKQLKETELFGPTFQQVPKDIRKERGIVPSSPQFKKEAGYAIPQPIPGKQSGAASLGGLLGLLASGGLMYAGTTPQAQAAMQRASGAIRDIGISPDLLQGKGEELGRLGTAYVTAGNPQYRQQLLQQINIEKDPVRYNMLLAEYQKAGGNVPGGRGAVIPPQ